jgi:cobalt-zinc-cadmium efflux system membrane fusion protein
MRWKQPAVEEVHAKPNAEAASDDSIEASPEQLKQIRVEDVREIAVDADFETTAKVGFNEDRMTPVFPPYAGRVMEVRADKGDVVRTGQPLLVIESPDVVSAVNDLAEALADADKSKIAVEAADKAAQRARTLNSLEALATKELQSAEAELARAQQDARRAQTAVTAARNHLALFGKSPEEIAQLEKAAPTDIDRKVTISAPIGGTIVDRKVGPGQYIKPDSPDPLYVISDLSTVWVNADVFEKYLSQIHVGAPVEISVAAYPDRKFSARIDKINPTLDPATRTVHVRCLVANANGLLKPEMFASIRIASAVKRNVAAVPSSAILTRGADSFVLVENPPGRFRKRAVKAGKDVQGYTTIEDGLRPGARVASSGVLLLSSAFDER